MADPDPRSVDVAAAVIADARGRILLARRTEGRDLAGLWEFPGGKHEPGETPAQALCRELHEELGIEAAVGAHLIRVPQRYPDKRLRLDVYRVDHWTGTPKGREGQALAWVPAARLASYAMPPADLPVVSALLQPARYLVTPPPATPGGGAAWLAGLSGALASGIRRVQLRAGGERAPEDWPRLAAEAAALCREAGAEVLLNGDPELAQALGIGVHLRAAQLHALRHRPWRGGQPVAASCHEAADLEAAARLGCDFVVLGPLRPTATHPGARGLGWPAFAALREGSALPIYAIGGLGPGDIAEARRHGAQGIAAIRGLWRSAGTRGG